MADRDWKDLGGGFAYFMGNEAIGFKCPHRQRSIPFVGEKAWDLVSREPLTLSPSINCLDCGCHGFIQSGKWVSA